MIWALRLAQRPDAYVKMLEEAEERVAKSSEAPKFERICRECNCHWSGFARRWALLLG
jgi:hypothetical protein